MIIKNHLQGHFDHRAEHFGRWPHTNHQSSRPSNLKDESNQSSAWNHIVNPRKVIFCYIPVAPLSVLPFAEPCERNPSYTTEGFGSKLSTKLAFKWGCTWRLDSVLTCNFQELWALSVVFLCAVMGWTLWTQLHLHY